jgi:two-component system response regulator YesN
MNGIELLKKADQCYPDTVFIMLTCLEEFTLTKEAMRYGAVDYILKTELDEQELRASLGRAKGESDARRKLSQSLVAAEVNQTNDEAVRAAMLSRIIFPNPWNGTRSIISDSNRWTRTSF